MSKASKSSTEPTLIFIPDISGYSKFVNETEIEHSQHIIEELLEILIDANEIDLQVSEIEGDAILFYRQGENTTINKILNQVEGMYMKFHTHLKMYENSRICECGACSTANNLKLKFIITFGEVGFNKIKDHYKLFGREVIIAHRLLKNNIIEDEYVLLTKYALGKHNNGNVLSWANFTSTSEQYDVGSIEYEYSLLNSLSEKVPQPKIESYGLSGPKSMLFETNSVIESNLELVFDVLSDYSIRHLWSVGLKGSDQLNGKISKNGSTHRCLVNNNRFDPFFVAHDFKSSSDNVVFTETDKDKGISVIFSLTKVGPEKTEIYARTYLKSGFLKRAFFSLFLKKSIIRKTYESYANLDRYCKILTEESKSPKSKIVLAK